MLLFATALTIVLCSALLVLVGSARRFRRREALCAWGFLLPSLVHLSFFMVAPLGFSLYMAFHRWELLSQTKPLVGLAHFASLLGGAHTRHFWRALLNTALYTLHVPVSLAIALAIGLLLNRLGRGRSVLQTIFFLPNLCLLAGIAVVWKWLYNPQFGLINRVLDALGVENRIGWLTSPQLIAGVLPLPLLAIMIMAVWMTVGVQAVIYLAGLRAIPANYYDAARVDGASSWQIFRHVTLPLLKPTTLFLLVTSVIASFQVFTLIYVMVDPIVMRTRQADVLVYQIYDHAWGAGGDLGLAAAQSWLLFVIVLSVTALQFKLVSREANYP